jgi:hypothetical protein
MAVAHPDQLFFKCNAFFEQLQFVFVVVVADCKTAQFQRHGCSLERQDRRILSQRSVSMPTQSEANLCEA